MNPLIFALTAVAGGVGAATRYSLDIALNRRLGVRFPWGLFLINVSGSFVLGLLTGLTLPSALLEIVGTGFLGGYTTFSSVAVAAALSAREGLWRIAVLNTVGTLVFTVAAAWAGLALGGALS